MQKGLDLRVCEIDLNTVDRIGLVLLLGLQHKLFKNGVGAGDDAK